MIEADDLDLLITSFTAALVAAPGAGEADAALFELGWGDLLAAAPTQGAAAAFGALGATGSAACLLDDVVVHALGLDVGPTTGVVLPAPQRAVAPGRLIDGMLIIEGLVSARCAAAESAIVPVSDGSEHFLMLVDARVLPATKVALDPRAPFHRAIVALPSSASTLVADGRDWDVAVAAARAALAHQLIAASRAMLAVARQHAVDRVQFGRPIASFQALRHKLAESLAAIEGAAAVAEAFTDDSDPLLAAVAKSLAGKAARTTATHAQQVLAGIGFTTDHQFHLSLKRTLVLDTLFGSARTLPTEIGAALLALSNAPRLVEL